MTGITFCSKKVLQYSIILLGFGLSLQQVVKTGMDSLAVMLLSLTVALVGALLIGKRMGVGRNLISLVDHNFKSFT